MIENLTIKNKKKGWKELLPERDKVRAREEGNRHPVEAGGGKQSEMKLLEVWANGGIDPRVNRVVIEGIELNVIAWETELPNNARFAESEDSVDENGEDQELFVVIEFINYGAGTVAEIQGFEILPNIAPFARNEGCGTNAGFGREEGEDVM